MNIEDFAGLDVARYRLVLRAVEPASLPEFLGSTLRGAFGHALKRAVCVMSDRACSRCMVQDRCLYPYLFETAPPDGAALLRGQRQAPHPFILTPQVFERTVVFQRQPSAIGASLEGGDSSPLLAQSAAASERLLDSETSRFRSHVPPAATPRLVKRPADPAPSANLAPGIPSERRIFLRPGDPLSFDLVLMGRAIDYLPYVVFAVSEMARRGLGFDRRRFELDEVFLLTPDGGELPIYSARTQRLATPAGSRGTLADLIRRSSLITHESSLSIRFLTPTRIRIDGAPQSAPSFDLLIRSLLRRISMVFSVHGRSDFEVAYQRLIERAGAVRTRRADLRWWDFERYSNRQQRKMKLGGFVGEIEYEGGSLEEFLPLIAAGEILHAGSNTTFGLGLYQILSLAAIAKGTGPDHWRSGATTKRRPRLQVNQGSL